MSLLKYIVATVLVVRFSLGSTFCNSYLWSLDEEIAKTECLGIWNVAKHSHFFSFFNRITRMSMLVIIYSGIVVGQSDTVD